MPFQTEERLSSFMDKTHRSKILRWALKIQNLQQSTTFSVGMLVPLIIFKKPKRKPGWSRPATRVIMMDVDPQQSSIEGPWNVNHHCWIFFCAYDYCKQCVWASCVAVLWRCIDFAWGVCHSNLHYCGLDYDHLEGRAMHPKSTWFIFIL